MNWWRSGVLYQLYPRSFADADGDGHGDLHGVIEHLDHLAWLGVDAIWLSPIHPSPNADWGYDVADYTDVHPDFGDARDARPSWSPRRATRGIRVILDLVPNHTSDRHPWFVESRSSRTAPHRDWYVWADALPDGSPPNNWVSVFGGSAWTWDETTQPVLPAQLPARAARPQLVERRGARRVRRHPAVLVRPGHRGVPDRRRPRIVKDAELRDNPLAVDDDDALTRVLGQRQSST